MKNNIKEKILKAKSFDDIEIIETKILNSYRDKFYNKLLKDKKVKVHLAKIFNVDEEALQNVLMINHNPPIDVFNEEDIFKNDENFLFDDRELEGLKNEPIKRDEDFEKKLSQEIDNYLKENPLKRM